MTLARLQLGGKGEALAASWYEAAGYRVLARNWRSQGGELDLVVRRGSLVAFCEVKTRSTSLFGSPAAAVGPEKQRRLRRLAGAFRSTHDLRGVTDFRFDVAAIIGTDVEVIEAAF